MVDLTYDCLKQMDQLVLQSTRGVHLLFERNEIITALDEKKSGENQHEMENLKKIQEVLYKFISLKGYNEKKEFLKKLKEDERTLLIRAYFKIVENSMINRLKTRH